MQDPEHKNQQGIANTYHGAWPLAGA
jgi:hypothetical protein